MTIDLKPFCRTMNIGKAIDLTQPWSAGEYTYAANGHIMVRVPRRDDVPERSNVPLVQHIWDGSLIGREKAKPLPKVPSLGVKSCETCEGSGRVVTCNHCAGEGVQECDMGHEHECEECDGDGEFQFRDGRDNPESARPCEDCEGKGTSVDAHDGLKTPVLIGDIACVALGYLMQISELPGVTWAPSGIHSDAPIPFWFEGGEGLLMGMRFYEGNEHIRISAEGQPC